MSSHAGTETVFWRLLFPADIFVRVVRLSAICSGKSTSLANPPRRNRRVRRRHPCPARRATLNVDAGAVLLTEAVLKSAGEYFKRMFDPRHGGFGGAPKFPQPSLPSLLLRCAKRFHDDEAARMVLHTCDRMAAGGIHDQLGAALRVTRWTPNGSCRISRRCSTIRHNSRSFTSMPSYFGGRVHHEPLTLRAEEVLGTRGARPSEGNGLRRPPPADILITFSATWRILTAFLFRRDATARARGKFYCWTHDECRGRWRRNPFPSEGRAPRVPNFLPPEESGARGTRPSEIRWASK